MRYFKSETSEKINNAATTRLLVCNKKGGIVFPKLNKHQFVIEELTKRVEK